jgi:hypothetical protein
MAVTPFIKRGSKNVWCIVDNHAKFSNGWAREISINLSDHMIFKIDLFGYDIYIGDDEDELLRTVSIDYEYAIVVASGTSFTLSDKLFPLIEDLLNKDFFIAGHILDRGAEYPELHHQFYVINLVEYRKCHCPIIGPGKEFNSLDMPWHGHHIMRIAEYKTIDIGTAIRNAKRYLYYEHEHVFLKELSNIYHDQFFANNFFASWNSDKLYTDIAFAGPVDQYVTVGIGLNWIKNLEIIGFTKDSNVVFTDINHNCLVYMKKLIETWDGMNYTQFYKDNSPMGINGESPIPQSYYDKTQSEWEQFISTFDDWASIWNQVRQLKFKYILTNYMSNYNFDWIDSEKRTVINLSDLFTHTPYIFVHSLKYRIASENKLFKMLVEKDPEITLMLTSRAVNGFAENNQLIGNRLIVGKVKDFALTDIKDLRCPPWHKNDW